jgi:hypothetical protein
MDLELLKDALIRAGAYNKLLAAQWLRQHGAEWPTLLQYQYAFCEARIWSDDVIAWARAEGCTAPTTYNMH